MRDVMVDLETMGKGPEAAIIAIGAVEFDLETGELGDEFYVNVDLESSVRAGLVMDASTVMWWMRQSDEARNALEGDALALPEALERFSGWMENRGEKGDLRVWGNGATFDNVILASAYRKVGMARPWEFWGDRCYRTVKGMHPEISIDRVGTHHNALHDAVSQARHLIVMLGQKEAVSA